MWKPSPSLEVTPLISPHLRPCHKVEISQDNDPSWSSSTKGVNGISNHHFCALDTGNLHKLFCNCGPNDEALGNSLILVICIPYKIETIFSSWLYFTSHQHVSNATEVLGVEFYMKQNGVDQHILFF